MIRQIYPLITTAAIKKCKRFYQRFFAAEVVFETEWYLQLRVAGIELGFISPDAPKKVPVYRQAMVSKGLSLVFEVTDGQQQLERIRELGGEPLGPVQQTEWGDFYFRMLDPAGTVINLTEQHNLNSDIIEL